MKRSICWITSGYFLQVDLPILYLIKEHINLKWIVYAQSGSDMANHAQSYANEHGIEMVLFSNKRHRYNPLIYAEFAKQMKTLSELNADIYYFDIIAFPYLIFAIKKYLPSSKVVMAMHHGGIHKGMRFRHIYKHYLRYACCLPFWFQYFSDTQASYFTGNASRRFMIPLALNDFGKSTSTLQTNCVTFLSFGHIIETKNIGLLIRAACLLKERCTKPFKVRIVGHCRVWSKYQELIKYPEIFDLNIKRVPDEVIADLFSSAHYLVLPYKSVTQSGPLRIAYGYNTPVIVSDLEGFKESVVEGVTGLFFKSEDVESLVSVMQKCLEGHPSYYRQLKDKQRNYVEKNLSVDSVVGKYIDMFTQVLKKQ